MTKRFAELKMLADCVISVTESYETDGVFENLNLMHLKFNFHIKRDECNEFLERLEKLVMEYKASTIDPSRPVREVVVMDHS